MRINNSFVANMSGPEGAFVGTNMFGNGPGTIFVSFSTILASVVHCGSAAPACAGGTDNGSCVDNSIIVAAALSPNDDVVRGACKVNYSLAVPQTTPLGGSNNLINVQPLFVAATNSDYHLQMVSPAVDAADPAATNAIDYDGVLRPQGARRDLGAFEFK